MLVIWRPHRPHWTKIEHTQITLHKSTTSYCIFDNFNSLQLFEVQTLYSTRCIEVNLWGCQSFENSMHWTLDLRSSKFDIGKILWTRLQHNQEVYFIIWVLELPSLPSAVSETWSKIGERKTYWADVSSSYFSKLQNIFVWILKYICSVKQPWLDGQTSAQTYLYKL